jgi:hypothetical protein
VYAEQVVDAGQPAFEGGEQFRAHFEGPDENCVQL